MAETAAPPRPAEQVDRGPAYDEDLFLWTQRQATSAETGFAIGAFPKSLPYTAEQILDDFYPGAIDER